MHRVDLQSFGMFVRRRFLYIYDVENEKMPQHLLIVCQGTRAVIF